jgi:hypothetical protein
VDNIKYTLTRFQATYVTTGVALETEIDELKNALWDSMKQWHNLNPTAPSVAGPMKIHHVTANGARKRGSVL